jgi:hypothetical protein
MILLIVTIITGLAWGVSEGITMVQFPDRNYRSGWIDKWTAGARSHKWFGWYHAIDSAAFLGAGVIGWILHGGTFTMYFLAGVFLIGWQMKETGYSLSRWGALLPQIENLNVFDVFETPISSYIMLLIRFGLAIPLLIGGFK